MKRKGSRKHMWKGKETGNTHGKAAKARCKGGGHYKRKEGNEGKKRREEQRKVYCIRKNINDNRL